MTTVLDHDEHLRTQIPALVPWALIAGGALFFVGGAMHPEEDPPDVTLKEHLRVMYEDGNWYASHTLQFIGVALVAAALVALARSGALASSRQAQRAGSGRRRRRGRVGVRLVPAPDRRHRGRPASPPTAARRSPMRSIVVETITVPVFCLGLVLLAVVGLRTGHVGNRTAAACALVGGVAYAVAGATFAFTDALDPLFPLASFIGVWAVVTGVSLHRRRTGVSAAKGS